MYSLTNIVSIMNNALLRKRGLYLLLLLLFTLSLILKLIYTRYSTEEEDVSTIMSEQQVPLEDYGSVAYVTLCTHLRCIYPAMVLHHQLRKTKSKINYVIIMPSELHQRVSLLLETVGIKVSILPTLSFFTPSYKVDSISTRKRDKHLWKKLYIWKLIEYEKCIMLDSDMLLLGNIDHLFALNAIFAGVPAAFTEEKILFWQPPEPNEIQVEDSRAWSNFTKIDKAEPRVDGFNGGLMLMRPNEETFLQLVNAAKMLNERTCCPTQEFLFRFFELRGEYTRLPLYYNVRKLHLIKEEDRLPQSAILVYHFVERQKPWMLGRKGSLQNEFANQWWKMADDMNEVMENSNLSNIASTFVEIKHAAMAHVNIIT